MPRSGKNTAQDAKIPLAEWIVGVIGMAIVSAAVGIIMYDAVAGDRSPPDIAVRVESIAPIQNGFAVKFRAINEGGEPASDVIVEGTRTLGDHKERAEAALDYLPSHSERRGGLFFQNDPRNAKLELRALGYREP